MPDGIQVYIDQLPKIAQGWDEAATKLAQVSRESSELVYRDFAGIFAAYVRSYNAVSEKVSQLCGQGSTQMAEIAQALMVSYNNYVATEAQNTQLSQGL
jgi:Excreted virulence factor EspC, type VII ESX diderm